MSHFQLYLPFLGLGRTQVPHPRHRPLPSALGDGVDFPRPTRLLRPYYHYGGHGWRSCGVQPRSKEEEREGCFPPLACPVADEGGFTCWITAVTISVMSGCVPPTVVARGGGLESLTLDWDRVSIPGRYLADWGECSQTHLRGRNRSSALRTIVDTVFLLSPRLNSSSLRLTNCYI